MFFSTYVLTKKGPLAKIWLAAHWEKRLTKSDVRVVDLNETVVQIVNPTVPIALRTSGELLVGVVRIYALKVKHLLKDASEVTLQLRAANVQLVRGSVAGGKLVEGGKQNQMAVTMDLVVARAGAGGGAGYGEADFDAVADILRGASDSTGKASAGKDLDDLFGTVPQKDVGEVMGTAWFAAEPSQFLEEIIPSQDDEIARMRQDLMAFGDGRKGDDVASTASKKSSNTTVSSIEKGRTSGNAAGELAANIDIGVPPPEDFALPAMPGLDDPFGLPPMDGGAADPYALPEFGEDQAVPVATEEAAMQRPTKKFKTAHILDTTDTILTRQEVEGMLAHTTDLVLGERRHGPLDDDDLEQRAFMRQLEQSHNAASMTVSTAPMSGFMSKNGPLKAVYEAAMKQSVSTAVEAMEGGRATEGQRRSSGKHGQLHADDAEFLHPHADGEVPPPEFEYIPEGELLPGAEDAEVAGRRSDRKRARGQDGVSEHAKATLERLKNMLAKKVGSKATFTSLTQSMKREEVALSFVDVLALASRGVIDVHQKSAYGAIEMMRNANTSQEVV